MHTYIVLVLTNLFLAFCYSFLLQFDPLSVEACQAATAVLLLDSNEDDVVIKATEGIYKFAEKSSYLLNKQYNL